MRKSTIKPETARRYFRKHGIYFSAVPDESGRTYAPSEYGLVRHAEYPVPLSTKHPRYTPRVAYQKVEIKPAFQLTSYALRLVARV